MSELYDRVLSKPELRQSKPSRADFAAQARNPITVVLDGVHGNYNIGAIFRLCDAFLIERLVLCGEEPGSVLLRHRRLVQAAMGTQRCWIAAVELTAASVRVAGMQPRFPAILVLGNEQVGVSPEVLACADQAVANSDAGHGELAERRHGRRHRAARAGAAAGSVARRGRRGAGLIACA